MIIRSPYEDVGIPEVSLYEFLFGDFGDRVMPRRWLTEPPARRSAPSRMIHRGLCHVGAPRAGLGSAAR